MSDSRSREGGRKENELVLDSSFKLDEHTYISQGSPVDDTILDREEHSRP